MTQSIALILCGCGWGAPNQFTALGPGDMYPQIQDIFEGKNIKVINTLYHHPSQLDKKHKFKEPPLGEEFYAAHVNALRHHQSVVAQVVSEGYFPIILGGDHSIAMATWSGIRSARSHDNALFWFDAHMDANTLETTPSNAPHGMPLAVAMGRDVPGFSHLVEGIAPLKGHNLAQFGLRSYDGGEEDILKTEGANLYYMGDVKTRGLAACFEEAFTRTQAHTPYFGVSIDIDGFDPELAPGTGMHEPDGLNPDDVIKIIRRVGSNPNFVGLEIAEINLLNDVDNKTVAIVRELLKAAAR